MVPEKTPQISVVLPTFNRSGLLARAIESVIDQSFKDWELIVIDDASTDDTPEVLADWSAKDGRIKVFRNERNFYPDISETLNKGLKLARGKYVARLDDDDFWCDDDKLKKQFEFLESHPDYAAAGGGVIVIDENGRELFRYFKREKDEEIRKKALFGNPFSHTTVMFRRALALSVGGYGDWRNAEDWDLWLKMGEKGKLYNFREYFTDYVLAGQNKSFLYKRDQAKAILKFISSHKKGYPNFWPAYFLNCGVLIYSFLPVFVRRGLHRTLSYVKRRFF
jgi:glycosyltransferase involved in cell wall biosynthesis